LRGDWWSPAKTRLDLFKGNSTNRRELPNPGREKNWVKVLRGHRKGQEDVEKVRHPRKKGVLNDDGEGKPLSIDFVLTGYLHQTIFCHCLGKKGSTKRKNPIRTTKERGLSGIQTFPHGRVEPTGTQKNGTAAKKAASAAVCVVQGLSPWRTDCRKKKKEGTGTKALQPDETVSKRKKCTGPMVRRWVKKHGQRESSAPPES